MASKIRALFGNLPFVGMSAKEGTCSTGTEAQGKKATGQMLPRGSVPRVCGEPGIPPHVPTADQWRTVASGRGCGYPHAVALWCLATGQEVPAGEARGVLAALRLRGLVAFFSADGEDERLSVEEWRAMGSPVEGTTARAGLTVDGHAAVVALFAAAVVIEEARRVWGADVRAWDAGTSEPRVVIEIENGAAFLIARAIDVAPVLRQCTDDEAGSPQGEVRVVVELEASGARVASRERFAADESQREAWGTRPFAIGGGR